VFAFAVGDDSVVCCLGGDRGATLLLGHSAGDAVTKSWGASVDFKSQLHEALRARKLAREAAAAASKDSEALRGRGEAGRGHGRGRGRGRGARLEK
jgi:hypothetical protein